MVGWLAVVEGDCVAGTLLDPPLVACENTPTKFAWTISRFRLVPTGVQVISERIGLAVVLSTSVWLGLTTIDS